MKPNDQEPQVRSASGCDLRADVTLAGSDTCGLHARESRTGVTQALDEMRREWAAGRRQGAERYLPMLPEGTPTERVVDLIYGEYLLRQQSGDPLSADVFLERFPKYRRELERQLEFDAVLVRTTDDGSESICSTASAVRHPIFAGKAFPQSLGNYVLITPLDSGGQAEVYLALHQGLRKEVVVKLGLRPLDDLSPCRNRLLDEGRILARLDHPTIARVYDLGLHAGYPYVVMDYVQGVSLDNYHRQSPLSPKEAAIIVAKLARAVAYSHRLQVVHLDIKPKNVIVDADGEPRLIDFGLAQLSDVWNTPPIPGGISGTLQFMAPEQAAPGIEEVGPAADIYALGGLLYFLLTRHSPHEGQSIEELLASIGANGWKRERLDDKAIPARLRDTCHRAMATVPRDRYDTADGLADDLERFVDRGIRRHISAALVLVAAGVLLFGWWAYARALPPLGQPQLAADAWHGEGFLPIEENLPLVRGDEVRFRCRLPAECHAALFHFDTEANWHCLKRWESDEHPKTVIFPAAGQSLSLEGAPGTELIVLCVSRKPLSLEDLSKAWAQAGPLEPLKPYALGHLETQRGVWLENHSRTFGSLQQREDPEGKFTERISALASKLSAQGVQYRGISFFHR